MQGEAGRAGTGQFGQEKAQGDPINVHKYLIEGVKKREPDSSPWFPVKGQEAMGVKHRKFHLNTGLIFFLTVSTVKHWDRFPGEVGDSPSLEILTTQPDIALGNLLQRISRGLSSAQFFCNLFGAKFAFL